MRTKYSRSEINKSIKQQKNVANHGIAFFNVINYSRIAFVYKLNNQGKYYCLQNRISTQ